MENAAKLKEKLFLKNKNFYLEIDEKIEKNIQEFSKGYKDFLNKNKTEREVVKNTIEFAKKLGFEEFDENKKYKKGDKIYLNNRGKAAIMAVIGKENLETGINIIASHADSPRLDLKQKPLYEDDSLALFKTQYYGGIKKYQWANVPLAIHGTICKSNGEQLDICIGEEENEVKFIVSEILIHLAEAQMNKKVMKAIEGEQLNVLAGSKPFKDEKESDLIRLNILKLLNEKCGIIEEDLVSADLYCVPAAKASDIGLDSSMVAAYGQDDKVCVYTSYKAILDYSAKNKTAVVVFADKEEIGSCGNTGFDSNFVKNFIIKLCKNQNADFITTCKNSSCLSADVTAAFDPNWPDVFDKKNCAYFNKGVSINKYTGGRGKGGSSEASAEFLFKIRNMLNKNNIPWQACTMGKVDIGGGGTVAKYVASLDIDVIDLGVGLLSMHSPVEISSKLDIYMLFKAYKAFLEQME